MQQRNDKSLSSQKRSSITARMSKMNAFRVDYDFYFKNNQGIFVLQSQMKCVELQKIKRKANLEEYLSSVPRFEIMKQKLIQDKINSHQLTICVDVENVLVR
jgi:hypothetical protein